MFITPRSNQGYTNITRGNAPDSEKLSRSDRLIVKSTTLQHQRRQQTRVSPTNLPSRRWDTILPMASRPRKCQTRKPPSKRPTAVPWPNS